VEEVLAAKFESPEYEAVIDWAPIGSELVEKVACPAELIGTVANTVEPLLNVMLPVGVPVPGETTLTLAVNVTEALRINGLAEGLTVVVVEAGFTDWVSEPELPW
jgi:hypothetical protein